jgi:hypothetical protein
MSQRFSLFALFTGVLAMLAIAVAGAPAQAAGFTPINVWNSSHCLDNATENATRLQMWSCTGGSEQRWLRSAGGQADAFTFTNQNTGRCITAPLAKGSILLLNCNAASIAQQWRVFFEDNPPGSAGAYQVWQSLSSGYCLTTPSVKNGTLPRAETCDPDDQYDRWHQQ